jgi:SpoVK/Ycf46/Vps4 family AAA+-type ATPase
MDYLLYYCEKIAHKKTNPNTLKPELSLSQTFVQLARLALTGRSQDIQLLLYKASKSLRTSYPDLADSINKLLSESPTRATPLRKDSNIQLPVDIDSRLQLLRVENTDFDQKPILSNKSEALVSQIILERKKTNLLQQNGLQPTKTILFTGPPGVGKTMTAKWIAKSLNRPLLVLDLAAVMSSFLGRTGNNIRFVLDYAKNNECVLLLDEIDAIAKRRDDNSEIGELKRLVTVLLQEIDDWPARGILIAATNHPGLLDPALWRRFEALIEFEMPSSDQINSILKDLLKEADSKLVDDWSSILSVVFEGLSFSEIERQVLNIKRMAALEEVKIAEKLEVLLVGKILELKHDKRYTIAKKLYENNRFSQRRIQELTGVSRDTLRKKLKTE